MTAAAPRARVVVLVHGIHSSASDMSDLALRLRQEGHHVCVFSYDDLGRTPSQNGVALAETLQRLRARHPNASALDIVAHSMGGIVARAALNSLANPGWLSGADGPSTPRAGFAAVRLFALDTPWDGFVHEPRGIPVLSALLEAIARLIFWLMGQPVLFEMRGSSPLFEALHDTPLAGVETTNIPARQAQGHRDGIRSLDDLSGEDARAVVRFCLEGRLPDNLRLRNLCRGLAADHRFGALRAALRRDRESLRESYDRLFQPVPSSHSAITRDSDSADDAVDRVVNAMRAPAPGA